MTDYSLVQWLVLAFATFRLVRLALYDEITRPVRERLIASDRHGAVTYLFSCQWCTGVWLAAAVVALFEWVPWTFPLFVVFSLAGVSSFLHVWLDE